jgi:hypothetical protein
MVSNVTENSTRVTIDMPLVLMFIYVSSDPSYQYHDLEELAVSIYLSQVEKGKIPIKGVTTEIYGGELAYRFTASDNTGDLVKRYAFVIINNNDLTYTFHIYDYRSGPERPFTIDEILDTLKIFG